MHSAEKKECFVDNEKKNNGFGPLLFVCDGGKRMANEQRSNEFQTKTSDGIGQNRKKRTNLGIESE